VPQKQPKRGRLWLNDGSCIRLRPEHKDHVWSYDFMVETTTNGKAFRILNIIDEFTRGCLAVRVERKIGSQDVIEELFKLFILRGIPEHIRSDNGPEFTAKAVRKWLGRIGVKTLFIEKGSPLRVKNWYRYRGQVTITWTIAYSIYSSFLRICRISLLYHPFPQTIFRRNRPIFPHTCTIC
jgi:transposase InsO family protein